jgi:hypothetical protein
VAAQGWWVRVASKWMSSDWSRVKGCDPGSSLGHAHPHGGATTSSASFNGRRGKPFPRARRHCCCSPCTCCPCACCVLTCVTLSVCVCTTPVCVFASQSRAPQGRLKSPKYKSGLYTKFRDHGFLLTLERACNAQMWKGILRFRGVKSSIFFWPAGAAPQAGAAEAPRGRRGQVLHEKLFPPRFSPKNNGNSSNLRKFRAAELETAKVPQTEPRAHPSHCNAS